MNRHNITESVAGQTDIEDLKAGELADRQTVRLGRQT